MARQHKGEKEICLHALEKNVWRVVAEGWRLEPDLEHKLMPDMLECMRGWAQVEAKHLHIFGDDQTAAYILQYLSKAIKAMMKDPERIPTICLRFMLLGMSLQHNRKVGYGVPKDAPHRKHCLCEECAPELYQDIDIGSPQ